ncbi:MAG: hypothetical protein ACFB10_08025 [Salibacteraceae bacterium]
MRQLLFTCLLFTISWCCCGQDTLKAKQVAQQLLEARVGSENFQAWMTYRGVRVVEDRLIQVWYGLQLPIEPILKRPVVLLFDAAGNQLVKEETFEFNTGVPDCQASPETCQFLTKAEAELIVKAQFPDLEVYAITPVWIRNYPSSTTTGPALLQGYYVWQVQSQMPNQPDHFMVYEVHANTGKMLDQYEIVEEEVEIDMH